MSITFHPAESVLSWGILTEPSEESLIGTFARHSETRCKHEFIDIDTPDRVRFVKRK
jgi:hypothetical protein